MKRTLIAILAALLLASLMGCRQRQAGLAEYHEALSLIDQRDTPAALTLLEKAGHRATTDSANASGLHFMMADLYHRSGIRDSATLYYRKVLAHGSLYARRVSMLLRLGKTPTDIAQLTAHSKQSVTNTRSRLFEKTFGRKGTPADWDRLVSSL